jgi:hypothetical protein
MSTFSSVILSTVDNNVAIHKRADQLYVLSYKYRLFYIPAIGDVQ